MQDQLKSLGELLKSRRIERSMSLKEIETATSIRNNYLEAIEEGTLLKTLSPVYAQGFIKQYAQLLGLDGSRIIKEYAPELNKVLMNQEFAYGLGTLEVRGTPGSGVRWLPNLLWAGGTLAFLFIAWLFAKFLGVL